MNRSARSTNRCSLFWRLEDSENPADAGARAACGSHVSNLRSSSFVRKLCVVDALHGPRETGEIPASEIRGRKVRWPWSYLPCSEPFSRRVARPQKNLSSSSLFLFLSVMLLSINAYLSRSSLAIFFPKEGNLLNRYPQQTIYRWSFLFFDSRLIYFERFAVRFSFQRARCDGCRLDENLFFSVDVYV